MNVRTRLVSGFVLLALFVLALFGLVAHRSIMEINQDNELSLLKDFAADQATSLNKLISTGNPTEELLQHLTLKNANHSRFVLLDEQQQLIESPHNKTASREDKLFPYSELTINEGESSGSYIFEKDHYSWAAIRLKEPHYTLLIINKREQDIPAYSAALRHRLLITAFVIIWIAFWIALILSKRIVSRLDEQNAALIHQAFHDDLTDLPNRRSLNDHLQQLNSTSQCALLIVDLNNLRDINDTLGHQSGDQLVKIAAQRISNSVKNSELISRLGGDEFAVLCQNTESHPAEDIAREILYQISIPINIDKMDIVTHASIGCALYPQDADNPEKLLKRAEVAMFHAKQVRINYQRYNSEIDPRNKQRLELISSLREAIEQGQLRAFYQPKINLSNMSTSSVEVLVRWQHPEKGIIPPDKFIPLAESCDLIDKLTHWVLDEALRQCHQWGKNGINLSIAVNLSARNLLDANLASHVEALLNKWQVSPNQLKLEVTESMIMSDPEAALNTLNKLNKLGTPLSVDDYGTGYSSLAYIKRLPIHEIKIDRTFVKEMLNNREDEVIVNSTIELAHNLGLDVVAEGVEDEATLNRLAELKCDRAQGYYMTRPLPADQLDEWLEQSIWPCKK